MNKFLNNIFNIKIKKKKLIIINEIVIIIYI